MTKNLSIALCVPELRLLLKKFIDKLRKEMYSKLQKTPMVVVTNMAAMSYLNDGYDISCRSIQLNKTVPKISEIVRNIPDFEAEEACHVSERGT